MGIIDLAGTLVPSEAANTPTYDTPTHTEFNDDTAPFDVAALMELLNERTQQ